MNIDKIVEEIDAEIATLRRVRTVLIGTDDETPVVSKKRRGRPKGSKNSPKTGQVQASAKKKSRMSPAGRKRIAEAMKRRWAERRQQASSDTAAKKK